VLLVGASVGVVVDGHVQPFGTGAPLTAGLDVVGNTTAGEPRKRKGKKRIVE
jgi:hypothetical protein